MCGIGNTRGEEGERDSETREGVALGIQEGRKERGTVRRGREGVALGIQAGGRREGR